MDDTCGSLVPPMDTPALAQALDEVLTGTGDAEAISSGRSRSRSDVARELHAFLEGALARHAKHGDAAV